MFSLFLLCFRSAPIICHSERSEESPAYRPNCAVNSNCGDCHVASLLAMTVSWCSAATLTCKTQINIVGRGLAPPQTTTAKTTNRKSTIYVVLSIAKDLHT